MASEEDLRVAQIREEISRPKGVCVCKPFCVHWETHAERVIATALTAARAETWKEAIMFVNIADIGDAKGADATYKIGKMLEAAAESKVFSREDEQKNSENQESVK